MPVTATTKLPDAQTPSLGNGVEDEISVDYADVLNNGWYRVEWRVSPSGDWKAALGDRITLDLADSLADWSAAANASISLVSNPIEQGDAVRVDADAAGGNDYDTGATLSLGGTDLSGATHLQFWTHNGLDADDYQVFITDGTNGHFADVPADVPAAGGELVQVPLQQYADNGVDLSSVDSVRFAISTGSVDGDEWFVVDSVIAGADTVGHTVTDVIVKHLRDGESYDVRLRTETEHATGAWTTATSITTQFPGYVDLQVTATSETSITMQATDRSDNEDGIRVYRADETTKAPQDTGFDAFQQVADLQPNDEEYTDSGLDPNRAYRYYWEPYTEDTSATTGTVQATADLELNPSGWTYLLTNQAGESIAIYPDDLRGLDLNREHTAMSDHSVTLPYLGRRIDFWMTSVATAELYFAEQGIFWGYLERSSGDEEQDTHKLEGRGIGRDLTDIPVSVRFQNEETMDAIEQVWGLTGFDATVTRGSSSTTVTDKTLVSADTTSEFESAFVTAPDFPYKPVNGGLKQLPTSYFQEGENADRGTYGSRSDPEYSGIAAQLSESFSDVEYDVTFQHDIPASRVGIQVRWDAPDMPGVTFSFNGNTLGSFNPNTFALAWNPVHDSDWWGSSGSGYTGGDLQAGQTYTLRISIDSITSSEEINIDCIDVYDLKYPPNHDDSVDADGNLSGPEPYTEVEVPTVMQPTTANIEEMVVTSSWNDTSGTQALWVSNSDGDSYEPQGGASNTDSLTESMDSVGTEAVAKARLSGWGTQATTPTQNPNPQIIQSFTLQYTGSNTSVIDDERFTGSALDVQQTLHRRAGARFTIPHGTDTKQVETFPKGHKGPATDWTVKNRKPAQDLYDYANKVVVYGAEQTDGTRPKAIAEDAAEIQAVGREVVEVLQKNRIDSLDGVKSVARKEVAERVDQRSKTGTLDVWPVDVLPGYAYDVDWYGDGQTVSVPLERVTIREEYSSDTASLKFERDRGNRVEIVAARYDQESLKSLF